MKAKHSLCTKSVKVKLCFVLNWNYFCIYIFFATLKIEIFYFIRQFTDLGMILQLKLSANNLSCQNLGMSNLLHTFSNRSSVAGITLENVFTFLRSCTFRRQQKSVYKSPYFAICSKRSASEC